MVTFKEAKYDERLFQKLLALPYDLEIKDDGDALFVLTPRGHEGWTWEALSESTILPEELKAWRIETNARRQIFLMPAPRLDHQRYEAEILFLLRRLLLDGSPVSQCGVQTSDGTKQPDVVWASDTLWRSHPDKASFSSAPEVCVEVLSPSNSRREIEEKLQLYLEAGAQEVWVCDDEGVMTFFNADGAMIQSRLCPNFPARIGPFA